MNSFLKRYNLIKHILLEEVDPRFNEFIDAIKDNFERNWKNLELDDPKFDIFKNKYKYASEIENGDFIVFLSGINKQNQTLVKIVEKSSIFSKNSGKVLLGRERKERKSSTKLQMQTTYEEPFFNAVMYVLLKEYKKTGEIAIEAKALIDDLEKAEQKQIADANKKIEEIGKGEPIKIEIQNQKIERRISRNEGAAVVIIRRKPTPILNPQIMKLTQFISP